MTVNFDSYRIKQGICWKLEVRYRGMQKQLSIHFCSIVYCILGCFVQKMSDKDKADRMPGGRADTAVVPLVVDIVTVLGRA